MKDFGACLHMRRWGFPGGSVVKNLPTVQETQEMWVWSLGREDPLEEKMAAHSSICAWNGQRSLASYNPWGRKESAVTERLSTDVKRYKNRAHTIASWKYLCEDQFCQFFPERRAHQVCSPPWTSFKCVGNQPLPHLMIECLWRWMASANL